MAAKKTSLYSLILLIFLALTTAPLQLTANALNGSFAGLSKEEKTFLRQLQLIRVPVVDNQPPLSFVEARSKAGYLNDLFVLVAEKLGIKVQFVHGLSYVETLAALENRQVDLLNDFSSYGPKRDYALKTRAVHVSPFVAVGKRSADRIKTMADLVGKRLVMVNGFQQTRTIQDKYPDLNVLLVNNIDEAYQALRTSEADVYIDNATHAGFYLNKYLVTDLAIKGEFSIRELGELSLHFAVRNDMPLLHSAIEKVLKSLKRTDYDNLRAKWLPQNQPEENTDTLQLTAEEKQWLQQHKKIRLLLDPGWAPIEYIDSDGRFKGISIDYLQKIEAYLGIKFDFPVDVSWSEGIRMMRNKQLDMASSVSKTAERAEYSLFTEPYISIPIAIFAGKDVSYVGNMNSLADKRVAATSGYAVAEWIQRDYPDLDLRLVETPLKGLQLVSRGEVDVFVGNIVTTTYYIGKYNLSDIRQAGVTPYANAQRMAVRDDWPELRSILQKALNAISKTEKQEIYNRWMGLQFERTVDYRLVWLVLLVSSVIIFAVFYWNRKLKEAMTLAEIANEEKSRFLSNMSHELRTPMHAILSFSSLGMKKSQDDRAVAYFDKIHISGQRLTRLLDDLLDLSKLEAGKMIADFRPHDIGTLTRGCIESVESLSRDHHVNVSFLNTGVIKGVFDAKLISQVIINLLSNAIKFSPSNSKITIQIEMLEKNAETIIQFSIQDEGVGIPEAELNDVFNSFVQSTKTRSSKGGTGLGLPISKEIIELHHGDIWVESPPRNKSGGTEVIFQIPEKQPIAG